ncbi:suppressor APC domain-containing protein 2 [Electrophorus electricus]|uniref:suppressor APC domain-containing protein 2 n=1 Tax=Electrophorus electricus TaxID=8005 RepID=UPI0015CFF900|nr:suppressor APC domain-containing protein 2 [Electrophorus electricus]
MALVASDPNWKRLIYGTSVKKEGVQSRQSGLKITNMQPKETELSTEALPKAFLHSLRTLFDILDDERRGYVHISEIESRWQGSETQDLPGSVLECLRRVTPPHGCLTFERFVAGLRYSMLNPENGTKSYCSNNKHSFTNGPKPQPQQIHSDKTGGSATGVRPYEGHVRPLGPSNGANLHHSHASCLQSRSRHHEDTSSVYTTSCKHSTSDSSNYGTLASTAQRYSGSGYERTERSLERAQIIPERGAYRSDSVRVAKKACQPNRVRSIESLPLETLHVQQPSPQGGRAGFPRSQSETTTGYAGSRQHGRSREEQRRHTITNGVDYEMLKQMKELEQEKDSLLAGLDVVERAREWYQNQIHNVTERQRLVGQTSHCSDFMTESGHLNVLLPKLQEVSRCLNDLISCSGMSFCSSGTQASSISLSGQVVQAPPQAIQRLKDQNHLLTQEVTEKSERITQLEQEKCALIKQLFEARARNAHDGSALDSTFI